MDYSYIPTMDILFKSYFALDPKTGLPISTGFTLTADGIGGLQWVSPIASLSTYGAATGTTVLNNLPAYLQSTTNDVESLSTFVYSSINSTIEYIVSSYSVFQPQVTSAQLQSTVVGLGSAGYLSSGSFADVSTNISSLNDASVYFSTSISSLFSLSSVAQTNLESSFSTYTGTVLTPSLQNLGTSLSGDPGNGYISSFSLQSTVTGLPNLGYVRNTNLQSTISSLGSFGYISSTQLDSTVTGLLSSVNVRVTLENILGQVIIRDSQVTFPTGANISYFSTLYLSSIAYQGETGNVGVVAGNNRDIVFSSLQLPLSNFGAFVTSNSRMFIDYYPVFLFTKLSPNATQIPILTLTTTVVQGASPVPIPGMVHTGTLVPNLAQTTSGSNNAQMDCFNVYSVPIRMQLLPDALNFNSTLGFRHILTNGYAGSLTNFNALHNSTVILRTSPTNSVFLTLHNPPY